MIFQFSIGVSSINRGICLAELRPDSSSEAPWHFRRLIRESRGDPEEIGNLATRGSWVVSPDFTSKNYKN